MWLFKTHLHNIAVCHYMSNMQLIVLKLFSILGYILYGNMKTDYVVYQGLLVIVSIVYSISFAMHR